MTKDSVSVASSGIGLGCVLAVAISWDSYHSIFWAVLHGLAGWLFVAWWYVFDGRTL